MNCCGLYHGCLIKFRGHITEPYVKGRDDWSFFFIYKNKVVSTSFLNCDQPDADNRHCNVEVRAICFALGRLGFNSLQSY